jgi:enoyl-CoA hydratase
MVPYVSLRSFASSFGAALSKRSPTRAGRLPSAIGLRSFSTTNNTVASSQVGWDVQPIGPPESNRFVGTLTLNSPATLNALTVELGHAFQAACREISHEIYTGKQHVDVVVVTGAGDQAFSAGGDLVWLRSLRDNSVHANADLMMQFYKSFLCIRLIPVPIIAAMHGPAMGAGAGLALACDLRTACNKKKILGLHFSRLGIHTGMGASHYFPQAVSAGSGIINEILLTGRILSGQECFDLGLVNRLCDDAKGAAYELAESVTVNQHPAAIRTMVQTLRQRQDVGLEQALQREAMVQALCYNRADWGEGVTAIAEKRDPSFDPYHSK